jgi:hypothetical protein
MRFTVRGLMVAVAGVALVLGCLATYHEKLGCGQSSVPLIFHVVDDRDGRPIIGAKIALILDFDAPPAVRGVTEDDGDMAATCQAGHTSYRGPFLRRYGVFNYSYALRVEADGYRIEEGILRSYMKNPVYYSDKTFHPPIVVRLKKTPRTRL